MAVDLQLVFPQEAVSISSISLVPGSSPPTIDVVGEDFSAVDSVTVNDLTAPGWFVASRTRMFITLPAGVTAAQVQTVNVLSNRLVFTKKSLLKFQISKTPSKVTGILRLVQLFVKTLFTTPGTDIFNKRLGGGALKNLGKSFSKTQSGVIVSDFVVAVDNTTKQIIRVQGNQPQLPPDEKLLGVQVIKAAFSAQEAALVVSLEITSQAGRLATANVVF